MKHPMMIIMFASVVLIATAAAVNPADVVSAPVGELQEKAVEHLVSGNLTSEHISQELNATTEELKQKAVEALKQNVNISQEELEKRAKAELMNQVNQTVQQPGFEAVFALAGLLGALILLRRSV
jgi:PGF-CTERM protein